MAKAKKISGLPALTKKQARTEVYRKLSELMNTYKQEKGVKKFDKTLLKASRLFAPLVLKAQKSGEAK